MGHGGVAGSRRPHPQARHVAMAHAPAAVYGACKSAMALLPWNLPSRPLLFRCMLMLHVVPSQTPSRHGHPVVPSQQAWWVASENVTPPMFMQAYFALRGIQTKRSATRVRNNPQKKHEVNGRAGPEIE